MKTRGISPWKSELVGDELGLDHLHRDSDEDSEHVIVNDDNDLDENDFGAEDGKKAADNEDGYVA
jgi:hypothetical protein